MLESNQAWLDRVLRIGFGAMEETGLGRLTDKGVVLHGDTDDLCSRRSAGLCECDLQTQNARFAGTGGISGNNRAAGFVPAYLNTATGEALASRFEDGRPAPVHVLDGLPDSWIAGRDARGCVTRTTRDVIAGFLRDGRFFTREAAALAVTAVHPGGILPCCD